MLGFLLRMWLVVCCQFLVKLPVILLLVGGVANINCTALQLAAAHYYY